MHSFNETNKRGSLVDYLFRLYLVLLCAWATIMRHLINSYPALDFFCFSDSEKEIKGDIRTIFSHVNKRVTNSNKINEYKRKIQMHWLNLPPPPQVTIIVMYLSGPQKTHRKSGHQTFRKLCCENLDGIFVVVILQLFSMKRLTFFIQSTLSARFSYLLGPDLLIYLVSSVYIWATVLYKYWKDRMIGCFTHLFTFIPKYLFTSIVIYV